MGWPLEAICVFGTGVRRDPKIHPRIAVTNTKKSDIRLW